MSSPIEEIISELGNSDQPLLSSKLAELSNLSPEELALFERVWATIELKRRLQIVSRLVDLAEDDFELNFDSIFKSRLEDQDAEVRSKAIEGLWENEEPSLINPLIELLEQGRHRAMTLISAQAGQSSFFAISG